MTDLFNIILESGYFPDDWVDGIIIPLFKKGNENDVNNFRGITLVNIRFTASAFRKLPSIYVFSYFPFGFEGRMWDLIVSVPDHCLSFYLVVCQSFSYLYLTIELTIGVKNTQKYQMPSLVSKKDFRLWMLFIRCIA